MRIPMHTIKILMRAAVVFVLFFSVVVRAEPHGQSTEFFGVRRSIATIIFCGLGGAVLGISTLSFYGDPQNHISNITSGLALGIIGGSVYVTSMETTPRDPIAEIRSRSPQALNIQRPVFSLAWTF